MVYGVNKMDFLVQNALQNMNTQTQPTQTVGQANIKVVGCGGGGTNVTNWLYKKGVQGAEILAMNTDKQHLDLVEADKKLLIGRSLTRGLGCGGFPQKGYEAAKEQMSEIKQMIRGRDMVLNTAGMGEGTGTGCDPVVEKIEKGVGDFCNGRSTA